MTRTVVFRHADLLRQEHGPARRPVVPMALAFYACEMRLSSA